MSLSFEKFNYHLNVKAEPETLDWAQYPAWSVIDKVFGALTFSHEVGMLPVCVALEKFPRSSEVNEEALREVEALFERCRSHIDNLMPKLSPEQQIEVAGILPYFQGEEAAALFVLDTLVSHNIAQSWTNLDE